jgi:hypothetical protein
MAELDIILQKLDLLGLEDTKQVAEAVREHLEELEEIAAYDAAKAQDEPTESVDTVLAPYTKSQLILFFIIRHPEPVEGSAPQRRGS